VPADELGGDVAPIYPGVDDADRDAGEFGIALPGDVGIGIWRGAPRR
jgi:hypothetical protein